MSLLRSLALRIPPLKSLVDDRRELRTENALLTQRLEDLDAEHRNLSGQFGPFPPRNFYSPIPDPEEVRADCDRPIGDSLAGVDLEVGRMLTLADALSQYAKEQPFPAHAGTHRYYFENDFFSYGDGLVYYCLLRHLKPRRVIEVGIGFSSALLMDTVEASFSEPCEITFIDPYPDQIKRLLRDGDTPRLLTQKVQKIDPAVFVSLEAGDVLFIDSSHVSKIGSDVNYLLLDIVPMLAPGVSIHVHDIFWPFRYPEVWAKDGRGWNETYLLRALLTDNARLRITWFNDFLHYRHHARIASALPLWDLNPGGSLWLEVR